MSQLKLEEVGHHSKSISERRLSFTNALKHSFKNQWNRLTLNSLKHSFEQTVGGSTRDSTLFGKKELNMIYEDNPLECLPEGEGSLTEESLLRSSKSWLEIKDGLNKLNRFIVRKNYGYKIHALYKLISFKKEKWSGILSINLKSFNNDTIMDNKSQILPLTSRRNRREKKSFGFKFKEDFSSPKLDFFLKSKKYQEDHEFELNSEQDWAIHTIELSTKNEFGNFEEEEQIYLLSDWNDSFDHKKLNSFSFELENDFCKDNSLSVDKNLNNITLSSVCEEEKKNNKEIRRHSSIGSDNIQKEAVLHKKIAMNNKDIDQMTKQLEAIRKMFKS